MILPPNQLQPSLSDADDFEFDSREIDIDEPIIWLYEDHIESNDTRRETLIS